MSRIFSGFFFLLLCSLPSHAVLGELARVVRPAMRQVRMVRSISTLPPDKFSDWAMGRVHKTQREMDIIQEEIDKKYGKNVPFFRRRNEGWYRPLLRTKSDELYMLLRVLREDYGIQMKWPVEAKD